MTFNLTYQINGIDGQFVMPFNESDDVKYVCSQIKKEFGIIPDLTARIYGSELQGSNILSQVVRSQDVVTFDVKKVDDKDTEFQLYRQPIITSRYTSKTTFIVFSTINYKSMTTGNKIQIDIQNDTIQIIQDKIKKMIKDKYSDLCNPKNIDQSKIFLYLPGGIPFISSNINSFIQSFPDYMPHLYAIVLTNPKINDNMLTKVYNMVCNISTEEMKLLLSPNFDSKIDGLCQIASVLGYIQQNGKNVKRMIYSIAKYCPFAPLINGLYNLSCISRVTGQVIIQITSPLSLLFQEMSSNFTDQSNVFKHTVDFLTFFMNVKISDKIPCTEFIRPFYNIGYEKYFHDNFPEKDYPKLETVIAFDPDFRDMDWIRFKLPSLEEKDLKNAMELTKTLRIIPPMSLREMHRVSLFQGKNGPWLFLAASVSKEETEKDKIDYINPEVGQIEHDTYENISIKSIGLNYKSQAKEFDKKVVDSIDPMKVKQLVFIVIDKSGSMCSHFSDGLNRFQASQKFFIKFTQACYRFHTTSLYGSIMFNSSTEVRNELNPLIDNFKERMIIPGESPGGGTRMATAMQKAADLMMQANQGNKYPNATFRIIVISDGQDGCGHDETSRVSNFLLQNKIRVDAIIVSNDIARGLVAISRYTGGIATFPRNLQTGLELFNKEEFFNVDIRQFGAFRAPTLTPTDFRNLPRYTENDLDKEITIKPFEYADDKKLVTSPSYAISEYNKEVNSGKEIQSAHPNQKRIIKELMKILDDPDEDIQVFPLKERVDVWRVLIKGFGPLYEKKWFFLIIEFTPEYPQQYPFFRFIKPPFHPNITDHGRICLESLDQNYRSDKSIRDLIGEIRGLLFEPNFNSPVDLKRENLESRRSEFERMVNEWNNMNGKDKPEDWMKDWKIQPDGKIVEQNMSIADVPENFKCPITQRIMKEPVKAQPTEIYYEKEALKKYLESNPNPTCKSKIDKNGKPILLDKNQKLTVDLVMQAKIRKWIKDKNYKENDDDEDEATEEANVDLFKKENKKPIKQPEYVEKSKESNLNQRGNENFDDSEDIDDLVNEKPPKRLRPVLSK